MQYRCPHTGAGLPTGAVQLLGCKNVRRINKKDWSYKVQVRRPAPVSDIARIDRYQQTNENTAREKYAFKVFYGR